MADGIHFERFMLGVWQTNCYVVYTDSGACWVVDAGFEPEALIAFVEGRSLRPEKLILTHAHIDHIAGMHEVLDRLGAMPILIHEAEMDFLGDASLNLSMYLAQPFVGPEPTQLLRHGDTLELAGHSFEVRHTPGHSPGGICLYHAPSATAIVGDTLFNSSIGRHDFPTSDYDALEKGIREQLYTLPDATRILPGHMEATTIGKEKRTNPFVRA